MANKLPRVFINPRKSATYWEFTKPLVLLGVFGTPTIAWNFWNPHYYLGFLEPGYYLGFLEPRNSLGFLNPYYCPGFLKPPLLHGVNKNWDLIEQK